ncbi:hypothetical protein Psuf_021500 [Phytohabitans suffuscus]|uniref:SsuA/THI5-like domain-containing protein n=1 Tax=Phytohabitans suffuscus TaxID=624315 RepID=A0A6F8YFI8_9ACTN|nr:ABC transporter substrate-binding protein [Phytohabitans suffuscus]BCB84837.1 hypothetical protein Psuf_021500 [Phytohabitans suffuscus]
MASAVFLYAMEKGVFDRHGLDVEMKYVTPAAAQAALLAGDVDVAFDGDELMRAVAAAGRGKVFMTSGGMPFAIFSDEPLTVPGLRGKTISSTTPGSSFSSALMKTLRDAGLDPAKDVKIVYLQTVAAQYAALGPGPWTRFCSRRRPRSRRARTACTRSRTSPTRPRPPCSP